VRATQTTCMNFLDTKLQDNFYELNQTFPVMHTPPC
jgi:hypothetical protein